MTKPRYAVADVEALAAGILVAHGVEQAGALETAKCLVFGERSGLLGHGLMRLKQYLAQIRAGSCKPVPAMRIVSQRSATTLIDADDALGPVAAAFGMRRAIAAAADAGIGLTVVRSANHFGAAGYFAHFAIERGMIGFVASNVLASMPPPGGATPAVGNSAFAFGFPVEGAEPIVFDSCCSKSSWGVLMTAMRDGKQLPDGCFLDRSGNVTRDPDAGRVTNGGMLMPMGEHKGFGLALAISLLTGALGGGLVDPELENPIAKPAARGASSFCFIAIDVAALVPPAVFSERTSVLTKRIHESGSAERPTRLPGERAAAARASNADTISLAEPTQRELWSLAEEAKLASPAPHGT